MSTLDQMQALVAVVEEGGFTAAALKFDMMILFSFSAANKSLKASINYTEEIYIAKGIENSKTDQLRAKQIKWEKITNLCTIVSGIAFGAATVLILVFAVPNINNLQSITIAKSLQNCAINQKR